MVSPVNRSKPIASENLHWLFNELSGYYNFGNQELAGTLVRWNLLEEKNRVDETLAYSFLKWSLTVSFLELINALQWFSAGVLLYRQVYLPAQVLQMYYYSIFFSYGSFLAANGKGYYTVKEEPQGNFQIIPLRKVVWFENQKPPYLCVEEKGKNGEHGFRAKWFYEVLRSWDKKELHPSVLMFENERAYHTNARNQLTYSLSKMAEELHHSAEQNLELPTIDMLIKLWNRDETLIDYFTEEFWVFEHMKVPLGLHIRLLENYEGKTPYQLAQTYITEQLISRHDKTGMKPLLYEILSPILEHMKIKVG